MAIEKLYFKFMGDDCSRQTLTVSLTNDGHYDTKFASGGCRLTDEHWTVINSAFTFFNAPTFENAYAIDFDGGLTDGIERGAIRADLVA